MFKWFTTWFDRKCAAAYERAREEQIYSGAPIKMSAMSGTNAIAKRDLDRDANMQFRMHKAENGWVVEMHGYDQRADRHYSKLHLIGNGEDFDQAICHIITLEALRG